MKVKEISEVSGKLLDAIGEYFVGDRLLLQKVLAATLSNGHVLFEDNPGLGKTLLAKVFAKVTGCDFRRVQFTPDLMPSDIVGTKVWRSRSSEFVLEKGPVFTHIFLADEINRSPPKVQSALLECMEERQVTIEGETHRLDPPFFVMATQNPIELEGTYPLPEAQLDRFLLKISTGYVESVEKEVEILSRRLKWGSDNPLDQVAPVTDTEVFRQLQLGVEREIYVDEQILRYIANIVRDTRVNPYVEVGSSPRGGLSLLKVSKAHAAMSGRDYVIPDDVKTYAREVLCHRIIMRMEYTFDRKITPESVVDSILAETKVPRETSRR